VEEKEMLKEELSKIVSNDFDLPDGVTECSAVQLVIGALGSTDPVFRDELGYTILQNWLHEKNILSGEELTELLLQAISHDMLFYKIGEKESDDVFLRSFSALLIALILIRDNREGFLTEEVFRLVMISLVTYCAQEIDVRGYVEGKGWAHAAAHVSDAIDECVRSRFTDKDDCKVLWSGLLSIIYNCDVVFQAEEEERIATPLIAMVETGKVPLDVLVNWFKKVELPQGQDIQLRYRRINVKHLTRSLYMRFATKGLIDAERDRLLTLERRFNPS
jgi:hypothetical protein